MTFPPELDEFIFVAECPVGHLGVQAFRCEDLRSCIANEDLSLVCAACDTKWQAGQELLAELIQRLATAESQAMARTNTTFASVQIP